ncbi:MAG: hypothetical protein AAF492_26370, partial [Verrucomicrobiota bacterium]
MMRYLSTIIGWLFLGLWSAQADRTYSLDELQDILERSTTNMIAEREKKSETLRKKYYSAL